MNLLFNIRYIKRYFILSFVSIFLIFQIHPLMVKAINMDNYQSEIVIEELRLKVPADLKTIWLNAEKNIWDPWLSSKEGFMGRQLYWYKEKEEALILVNWKSKKLWKSISLSEVKEVQEKFENNVKTSLNVDVNPFQLIYEGELDKQI